MQKHWLRNIQFYPDSSRLDVRLVLVCRFNVGFIGELKTQHRAIESSDAMKRVFPCDLTWRACSMVTVILRWVKGDSLGKREDSLVLKFQTYLITFLRLESTYREICEQWRELIKKRRADRCFTTSFIVAAVVWIFLKPPGRPMSDFYYLCISSSQYLTVTTYERLTSVGLLLLGSTL